MQTRPHFLIPEKAYDSYGEYLSAVGGSAVESARRMSPDAVIATVARAGLRGRGGAGFPTGVKWRSIAGKRGVTKDIVCNAAEGEPGTFKDRYLIRKNPYSLLEGMLVAAHAVGARRGYLATKASFTVELAILRRALEELAAADLMDRFEIRIVEGPEEYLFGEEKALLNVIDGEGPLPRTPDNPPYERGVGGTPNAPSIALVNNVETFSHVSSIVRDGAASFRELGTSDTPGTVIFTLSGDVARPGVYELQAGLPLSTLFNEIGGGPKSGGQWKAALSGVSSRVIVPEHFDTHADFSSLALIGAGLGSAGFVLFDETADMGRVAQAAARFLFVESCNQCSACKIGLGIASRALDDLCDGEANDTPSSSPSPSIDRALAGAQHAPQGNRCYLPVQGSVLLPSLIQSFRAELQRGAARAGAYLIPKIVDYVEAEHRFILDEHQSAKRPDWTYEQPAKKSRVTAVPAARPSAVATSVHLELDLAEALLSMAEEKGRPLDREVDEALRAWVSAHRK